MSSQWLRVYSAFTFTLTISYERDLGLFIHAFLSYSSPYPVYVHKVLHQQYPTSSLNGTFTSPNWPGFALCVFMTCSVHYFFLLGTHKSKKSSYYLHSLWHQRSLPESTFFFSCLHVLSLSMHFLGHRDLFSSSSWFALSSKRSLEVLSFHRLHESLQLDVDRCQEQKEVLDTLVEKFEGTSCILVVSFLSSLSLSSSFSCPTIACYSSLSVTWTQTIFPSLSWLPSGGKVLR